MSEWSKLSAREKAAIMKFARENGVSDLKQIRDTYNIYAEGGGIHIDPSKKGTFTAAATKHGKSVQEFASQVLAHKENYSPAMVKKANFARNFGGHKHDGVSDTQYLNTRDAIADYAPQIIEPIQMSKDYYRQLQQEQNLINQGVIRDADIQKARESGFSLSNIRESSVAKKIQEQLDLQGKAKVEEDALKAFNGVLSMSMPSTYYNLFNLDNQLTENQALAVDLGVGLLLGAGPQIAKKASQEFLLRSAIRNFNKGIDKKVFPNALQKIELNPNYLYHREGSYYPRMAQIGTGKNSVLIGARSPKGSTTIRNGHLVSLNKSPYKNQDLIWWDKGGKTVYGMDTGSIVRVKRPATTDIPYKKAGEEGFQLRPHQNYQESYYVTPAENTDIDDIITFVRQPDGSVAPYSTNRVLTNKMSLDEMFNVTPLQPKSNATSPLMSAFDFSYSGGEELFMQFIYRDLLRSGKSFAEEFIPIPVEDLGRIVKGFPNSTVQEFENTVFPRMLAERPWIQPEEFLQNARIRIGNEYSVYPKSTFEKAFPEKNVKGTYWPDTDKIAVEQGAEDFALSHEVRHKLDNGIGLTQNEENILYSAFGKDFDELASKFSTASMHDEMVTTNLDARRKLIGDTHITKASVAQQNKIIDAMPDERVIEAIKKSNGYGEALIKKLDKDGKLTKERVQLFRDAMKKVGIAAAPVTMGAVSLNSNKKSTGGPLYPFSFQKNPYWKTPIVRYDNGGVIGHQYGIGDWVRKLFGIGTEESVEGLDYGELRKRQAYAESGFDNNAKSRAGARGMFQIMPSVLEDYNKANGTVYTVDNLSDQSINTAIRDWYIEDLLNRPWVNKGEANDSIRFAKALAGYNYGSGNVVSALNKAKADSVDIYNSWDWLNYMPKETQDYVDWILRGKNNSILRNDSAYKLTSTIKNKEVEALNNSKAFGGNLFYNNLYRFKY